MTMATSKPRPRLKERPTFIGGALHGVIVPEMLNDREFIRAATASREDVYMRTLWYQIDGSFWFYCRVGMLTDETTAIVRSMLLDDR